MRCTTGKMKCPWYTQVNQTGEPVKPKRVCDRFFLRRLWVFVMSCCMCSAVCMSVMTASFSGIAMGYNYSLAEYIDLKETNVSVYLKRGIFDDDLGSEEKSGRRAGEPMSGLNGLLKDTDLITPDAEEVVVQQGSRRSLDSSILKSDTHRNYEGSLLRLTVKPPSATEAPSTYGHDQEAAEIFDKYPAGSLDQLKALQSLRNMRRNNQQGTVDYDKTPSYNPGRSLIEGRRRFKQLEQYSPKNLDVDKVDIPILPVEHAMTRSTQNPIRAALPGIGDIASESWMLPKTLEDVLGRTLVFTDIYGPREVISHTYPRPIRYNTDPIRPTLTPKLTTQQTSTMVGASEIPKEGLDNSGVQVKDKLLMDKAMFPSFQKSDGSKSDNQDRSDEADYEEEARQGIRMRKKRNLAMSTEGVVVKETHYTLPNLLFNKYVNVENDRKFNKIRVSGESKTASNFETSINVTNSTTINKNEGRNNVTQHLISFENESSSIKGNIEEMSTINLNKFNYSLPNDISVKSHNSIISFIKLLLN